MALFEKRWWLLGFLNILYVWLYGGWLLAWLVVGVYLVVSLIYGRFKVRRLPWYKKLFSIEKDPRAIRLSGLSAHCPGKISRNFFGVTYKGRYNEVDFRASFWGAEKGSSPNAFPCLEVVIFKPQTFRMEVHKFE